MKRCGFCKSKESTLCYSTNDIFGNDYEWHQCHQCGAYFLAPYPDADRLDQAYDESYYGQGEEKFDDGMVEQLLNYFRRRRAKKIAQLINNEGKILDIGCGNGQFLEMIGTLGAIQTNGLEMPGNSANRAAAILGDRLHVGSLESGIYAAGSFDAITLFHVFEHLTEPQEYLVEISKLLKPGGILYMSFPNIGSIQSRIFKGRWLHLDPPRHLFLFKTKDFKSTMVQYGFEVIGEQHFNIEYNPFGFQQSLLNCLYQKRELLYEALKGHEAYVADIPKWQIRLQKIGFKISAPLFIILDFFAAIVGRSATVEFTLRKKH